MSTIFVVVCDAGLVQYRERLPLNVIVGACVGGGLFLIILVCAGIVVLCSRRASNQSHQQEALPQPQLQPRQHQRTHEHVRNVTEEGYINHIHVAPNDGIPFTPMEDNGKDLRATPARGIPMDQMAGDRRLSGFHLAHGNYQHW